MKVRILLLCAIFLAGSVALAQLTLNVSLINVVATVTDDRGRYVPNLTADDFTLEEDGKVQTISHISYSDDLPISLGVVLDTSGSMDRKIATATSAVDRFIRTIHKDDDIFLMTFSQYVDLAQDFTSDRTKLATALRRVRVQGGTALYDALNESLRHLKGGMHGKKAILLLTDGMDEDSIRTLEETQSAVRESEYIVYCLGISPSQGPLSEGGPVVISGPGQGPAGGPTIPGGPGGPQGTPSTTPTIRLPGGISIPVPGRRFELVALQQPQNPKGGGTTVTISTSVDMDVLNSFADVSGGRAWLVGGLISDARGNAIEKILDQLAEELRSQYSLGYYPQHKMDDKKWHHVEVRAKNPKFHVRARKDFFGS
ncbi:MAG TPA: VWA domain-containing protein [Terriglobia bacterium]|nr:VWA domain-containing protein [Terriglobia bacterium]